MTLEPENLFILQPPHLNLKPSNKMEVDQIILVIINFAEDFF